MNSELENAFNKELNIIKNDLYYQQIEISHQGKEKIVRFDMFYKPLEILSGDSYSLRKTKNGKVAFFLIDAMGKGISASLMATASTTLLNYIFNEMEKKEGFDFQTWVEKYIEYIKDDLLDNEMIAIVFALYDRETSKCCYASFGMPAMLGVDTSKTLFKIKSNNMPINKYTQEFQIQSVSVANIKKILIYTDGLCENKIESGEFYKNYLYEDFLNSHCISDFAQKVEERLQEKQDDIAYFYINSIELSGNWIEKEICASRQAVDDILYEMRNYIRAYNVSAKDISEIMLAMSELLLNALEHGVYGLSKKEKARLIESGDFDEKLDALEETNKNKHIKVMYCIKEKGTKKMFVSRIQDFGEGFDVRELRGLVINPESFNGRGIMIAKKLLDRFYYNEKGNSITMRKYLHVN